MGMAEREKLIELKDLQISFGTGRKKFVAVDHVNFDIYKGETFSLVGESGSGKTTIGRAILRINPTSAGDIYFKGQKINGKISKELDTEVIRKCQMIFQDPYASLDPRMTVEDIISEPLRNYHLCQDDSQRRQRVASLLEQVDMRPEAAQRYPHEFSGGQRQRIGIARALAVDPECVFCDEPISALDVSVQVQIVNMMQRLQQERGLSYLFIAHDLAMVHHMSRRMGVMYLGRLVELGPGDAVFHNPLHPYTQMLIASVPRPDPHYRRRTIVCGEVPSPLDLPKGCVFHPRCPYADEVCRIDVPHFRQVADDRFVACHHARGGRR